MAFGNKSGNKSGAFGSLNTGFTPGSRKGGGSFSGFSPRPNGVFRVKNIHVAERNKSNPWFPGKKDGEFDYLVLEAVTDLPNDIRKGQEIRAALPNRIAPNGVTVASLVAGGSNSDPIAEGDYIRLEGITDYAGAKTFKGLKSGAKAPEGLYFSTYASFVARGNDIEMGNTGIFSGFVSADNVESRGDGRFSQRVRGFDVENAFVRTVTDAAVKELVDAGVDVDNEISSEALMALVKPIDDAISEVFKNGVKHEAGTPGILIRVISEAGTEYESRVVSVSGYIPKNEAGEYAPVYKMGPESVRDNLQNMINNGIEAVNARAENGGETEGLSAEIISAGEYFTSFLQVVSALVYPGVTLVVIPTYQSYVTRLGLEGEKKRDTATRNAYGTQAGFEIDEGDGKTKHVLGFGATPNGVISTLIHPDYTVTESGAGTDGIEVEKGEHLPSNWKVGTGGIVIDSKGKLVKNGKSTVMAVPEGVQNVSCRSFVTIGDFETRPVPLNAMSFERLIKDRPDLDEVLKAETERSLENRKKAFKEMKERRESGKKDSQGASEGGVNEDSEGDDLEP